MMCIHMQKRSVYMVERTRRLKLEVLVLQCFHMFWDSLFGPFWSPGPIALVGMFFSSQLVRSEVLKGPLRGTGLGRR